MKKNLKITIRFLSVLLTLALIITSLPMQAFATENGAVEDHDVGITELQIKGEIVGERDAYRKVYELQNGSYYEINSTTPLHYKEDGEWVEAGISNSEPENTEEAIDYCRDLSENLQLSESEKSLGGTYGVRSFDFNEEEVSNTPIVNWRIIGKKSTTPTTRLSKTTNLIAQFTDEKLKNSHHTQATISSKVYINCKYINGATICAYEINQAFNFSAPNLLIEDVSRANKKLDFKEVSVTSDYSFDITDLYIKWERGLADNNGVVFTTTVGNNSSGINIYDCFTTRVYKYIDVKDTDFSYHRVEMGRAGNVFINDYTNTVSIVRNEFSLDSTIMPINLIRYSDYGHTDSRYNSNGDTSWFNYESCLKSVTSATIRWLTPDGYSIYFIPNTSLNQGLNNTKYWIDYKGDGYSLVLDTTVTTFENASITTPEGFVYTFGEGGKITKISDDYSNEINIYYAPSDRTQAQIVYIEDHLGRRLCFNYDEVQIDDDYFEVLVDITAKYPNGNDYDVIINDGHQAVIKYTYAVKSNNKVVLTGVEYPDGETVSYTYTNNKLTGVSDIDGTTLNLEYSLNSKDIYPCVSSCVKTVQDTENNTNITLSSLNIDCHNSYQRTFTDISNAKELIQYNRNLHITYYNSPTNTFFADYSINPNGYEYLSQIISPEDGNNLLLEPDFEDDGDAWTLSASGTEITEDEVIHGNASLKLYGASDTTRTAEQEIEIDAEEGDIFVIGGYSKGQNPIPIDNYCWDISIVKKVRNNQGVIEDKILYTVSFDPTINNEEQFKLGAYQLENDESKLTVKIRFYHQEGSAIFDDIIFYKTTADKVSFMPDPWNIEPEGSSSILIDSVDGYNSNGLLTYELYSKDTTNLLKTYEYDNNTLYRTAYTDENNVRVTTNYNAQTGILSSETLGNMTKEYSYNAVGALKEVSRADAAVNGDPSKITTKYSYSNDKIESIEHNGFVYTLTYNPYGSVSKIELNRTNSNIKDTLIEYEYANDTEQDITKVTYANGSQLISLSEDITNSNYAYSKLIKFKNSSGQEEAQYKYLFDSNDNLLRVIDYQSIRIIDYSNNSYIVYDALTSDIDSSNPTISEICEISTDTATGVKTIELFNDAYTVTEHDCVYNENAKTTTYVSDYDFSFGDDTLSFTSTSVLDFFGRKINSSTVFDNDALTKSITSTYTYKDFANRSYSYYDDTTNTNETESINTSSTLVSKYQTNIVATNKKSENGTTLTHSFISTYEYDTAGRVKEVRYGNSDNDLQLTHAYEYDCFGQLSKEIDFVHNKCTVYNYDYAGNITEKTIYSEGDFNYNNSVITITYEAPTDNEEENLGSENTEPKVVTYLYSKDNPNSVSLQNNDLLVQYDGKNITYDEIGNPNVYYGESLLANSDVKDITMDLVWKGTQLSSATNRVTGAKTDYKYDQDGNRTKKIFYEMQDVEVEENEEPRQELVKKGEIDYVYYDDMVSGYRIITSTSEGTATNAYIKLIYDEYNAPIGLSISSPTDISVDGNIVLAQNDILWFIKDGQGNVLGMYSEVSDFSVGCSYDAYGNLVIDNINMSAVDQLTTSFQEAIQNNPRWAGLLTLIYVITLAALVAAVVPTITQINQTYYQGYIFDAETGLYYCHNRYYSPTYGRFINMDDPSVLTQNMEEPLNANLYCYCYNDPINNNDPTGRSSYTLTGVGLQAEMSASLLSFAAEVGIELIYAIPKNTLYAYYYYGGGAGAGYSNKAINYFKSTLNKMVLNPSVSLNNIANLFKLNYSISIGFFIARTNKSFSWPNSYVGYAKSNSISIGKYKGYYSTGPGSKIYGICYCPIGNSGFGLSQTSVYYKRITFNSNKVKNYLSQNTNKIKNAIGK